MQPDRDAPEQPWDDLAQAVREELARLPATYRAPLELCYLRGLGHEEAAATLGWPLGTLKTRLVRGRRRLRDRLDRRGIALGIGLLLLLPRRAPAVPAALVESTAEAMRLDTTGGRPAVEPRYARASNLAEGLLKSATGPRWLWALLILGGGTLAGTWSIASLAQARTDEMEEFAALPANLTDVLNVVCR